MDQHISRLGTNTDDSGQPPNHVYLAVLADYPKSTWSLHLSSLRAPVETGKE
jgi:hypothetical protein